MPALLHYDLDTSTKEAIIMRPSRIQNILNIARHSPTSPSTISSLTYDTTGRLQLSLGRNWHCPYVLKVQVLYHLIKKRVTSDSRVTDLK